MTSGAAWREVSVWLLAALASAPAAAADSYLVPKKGFECFRNHIDGYRAAKRDPVVVYFPMCPKVDLTAEDLESRSANFLPLASPTIKGARSVITLTKSEIDCIASGKADVLSESANEIKINLGPCR